MGIWQARALYYITDRKNLPSILQYGILAHADLQRRGLQAHTVYDKGIVTWRGQQQTPSQKSLWEYANLYFQPRTPMLYHVIAEKGVQQLAILEIAPPVMHTKGAFFTTGNAARNETLVLPMAQWRAYAAKIKDGIQREWWSEIDGSKRRIMAEVLIPRQVSTKYITAIHVADDKTRALLLTELKKHAQVKIPDIIPSPYMFFLPQWQRRLTERLRLIEGDMFFSRRQTLTISVNTVCVMGKGLASRVRYQFPDAYVAYQDACRRKDLRPGLPYLYRRETPLELLLADEMPVRQANQHTWFLFFPTKRHWRHPSRLDDLERGLQWLVQNYRQLGIQSLAIPALGCGLGGLAWAQVGPLMVRYLDKLDIPVDIHLPLEQKVPEAQRRPEFLLPQPPLPLS